MIRAGDKVFIDSGAWIALAIAGDVHHQEARGMWDSLNSAGARPFSSVPVLIETFTYLDRKGSREIALRWRDGLSRVRNLEILPCAAPELQEAWSFLDRKSFHNLSLVDATSFVLMKKHGIRVVFAFDTHFAIAGFRYVGEQH